MIWAMLAEATVLGFFILILSLSLSETKGTIDKLEEKYKVISKKYDDLLAEFVNLDGRVYDTEKEMQKYLSAAIQEKEESIKSSKLFQDGLEAILNYDATRREHDRM